MPKLLAAGDDGSFADFKVIISSTDHGVTWAKITTAISDSGWSVAWAEDLGLWACGTDFASSTEQLQTSPDGSSGSWTAQSSPADNREVDRIIFGGGQFVALFGVGSKRIMTSPDGVTWTEQFLPAGAALSNDAAACYSPDLGLYVVGEVNASPLPPGFAGAVATSPDGITWTIRPKTSNMGSTGNIAWGNGTFVLIGGPQGSGEHLYVSTDGIIWTRVLANPGGTAQGWRNVAFGAGRFVAVSDDITTSPGQQSAYSTDGTTWTRVSTPGSGKKWSAIAYDGTVWVATDGGLSSTQPLMVSSDDGVTWSLITLGFSYGFMNGIASDFQPTPPPAATAGNIWGGGSGQSSGNHW